MATSTAWSVTLMINGIKTIVPVFGINSAQAAINAQRQVNPFSPLSAKVVSVNAINACTPQVVTFPVGPEDDGSFRGRNIQNY